MLIALCLLFLSTLFTFSAFLVIHQEKQAKAQLEQKFQTYFKDQRELPYREIMEKGFFYRLFSPLAQKFSGYAEKALPTSTQSWVQMQLVQAGYQRPAHLKLFLGTQLLLAAGLFCGFSFYCSVVVHVSPVLGLFTASMFAMMGLLMPLLWLSQAATQRRLMINRSLPDFMDLMVICVEAGLSMDMAIGKFAELKSKKQSKPLQQEFDIYLCEIGLGKPRNDALYDMCYRTGVEELTGLVMAIIQSFEMGTGIVDLLRVYAGSIRTKRLEVAKEKANKVPIKMVLPIYIFFFPAIFLTIFGPLGLIFLDAFSKVFGPGL